MNVFEMQFLDKVEELENKYKEKVEAEKGKYDSRVISIINKITDNLKTKVDEETLKKCIAELNIL